MEFRVSFRMGVQRGAEYIEFAIEAPFDVPPGEDFRPYARVRQSQCEAHIQETIAAYTEAHPRFAPHPAASVKVEGASGPAIEWIPCEEFRVKVHKGQPLYYVAGGPYKEFGVPFYTDALEKDGNPFHKLPKTDTPFTKGKWRAKVEMKQDGKPRRVLAIVLTEGWKDE